MGRFVPTADSRGAVLLRVMQTGRSHENQDKLDATVKKVNQLVLDDLETVKSDVLHQNQEESDEINAIPPTVGATGPAGPDGADGKSGEDGAHGKRGQQGQSGKRGVPGERGFVGLTVRRTGTDYLDSRW